MTGNGRPPGGHQEPGDQAGSRQAFLQAARESIGVPSAVLAAGYLGFGALANGSGFPLWAAMLSSATIFALPGQLAMLEMSLAGTLPSVIVVTVGLTAARFLPMAVTLMPMMRPDEESLHPSARPSTRRSTRHSWRLYAAAQLLAMTGWAASMRRFPELPPAQRLAWFTGFALTNWIVCLAATVAGYGLANSLPPLVRQGLVFVGPLYFLLILTGETRSRQGIVALACGAVVGPLIHLASPQWSVMMGGLAGGTLAWLYLRSVNRKRPVDARGRGGGIGREDGPGNGGSR
jgi:predicted branched-subunit amino acid permease